MDHEQTSDALTSIATKKLNAEAPAFVPRSVAPQQRVYAAPPPFLPPFPPPPYYAYNNYFQQNPVPFCGYSVNQSSPVELAADHSNGNIASPKNGQSDAHEKVLNQVEFYFSDINLATTDQLFRFMSNDPEGYVPLSVVASFKKVRSAINGSAQLASILRSSKILVVSEDGEKVKRQHPLTESDMEELQSRIVVAENLPEDHSHQNLMKIFSSVGSVKSIRTCPPQKSNGGASSASKAGKGDAMHLNSKFHAFVEYESVEVAEKAVVELTDEGNWRNGLKVRWLLKSAVKPTQMLGKKVGHEGQSISRKDEVIVPEMLQLKGNHSEESLQQSDYQSHERHLEDSGSSNAQRKGRNFGNGNVKGKGHGHGRGRPQSPINGSILGFPPTEISASLAKASGVPRMPDGTKGFSMGRGKEAVKIC